MECVYCVTFNRVSLKPKPALDLPIADLQNLPDFSLQSAVQQAVSDAPRPPGSHSSPDSFL